LESFVNVKTSLSQDEKKMGQLEMVGRKEKDENGKRCSLNQRFILSCLLHPCVLTFVNILLLLYF